MKKTNETILISNDGIGVIEAMETVVKAMKDIAPDFKSCDGVLEWDISKNVPGYSVKIYDEGVSKPQRIVVGKAKRKFVPKSPVDGFVGFTK